MLKLMRNFYAGGAFLLAATLLASPCVYAQGASTTEGESCNNQAFLARQQAYGNGTATADSPVHICGTVIGVKKRVQHTRSGRHGYFYVLVAPHVSIRIVSGLERMNAPSWPWVRKGDSVDIVGRYYYDSARSQGVDWTHHGTGREWHTPGYIIVNGKKYQ